MVGTFSDKISSDWKIAGLQESGVGVIQGGTLRIYQANMED